MQRVIVAALAPIVLCSLAILSGCGGDEETSTVTASPEAKKADVGAQDAMREFMQTKGAGKGKAKAKAPAAAPEKAPEPAAAPETP